MERNISGAQFLRLILLRTAVTVQSLTVTMVRRSRPRDLKPQHLTAGELLAAVCDASVEATSLHQVADTGLASDHLSEVNQVQCREGSDRSLWLHTNTYLT